MRPTFKYFHAALRGSFKTSVKVQRPNGAPLRILRCGFARGVASRQPLPLLYFESLSLRWRQHRRQRPVPLAEFRIGQPKVPHSAGVHLLLVAVVPALIRLIACRGHCSGTGKSRRYWYQGAPGHYKHSHLGNEVDRVSVGNVIPRSSRMLISLCSLNSTRFHQGA